MHLQQIFWPRRLLMDPGDPSWTRWIHWRWRSFFGWPVLSSLIDMNNTGTTGGILRLYSGLWSCHGFSSAPSLHGSSWLCWDPIERDSPRAAILSTLNRTVHNIRFPSVSLSAEVHSNVIVRKTCVPASKGKKAVWFLLVLMSGRGGTVPDL